jgi:hypothetical protein
MTQLARPWLRRLQAVAALGLLTSGGALAQVVNDAKVQTANAEWRRLSQSEVNCVDKGLRAQRSGVWLVIQQGVRPTDAAMAAVRAACRTQLRTPSPATVTHVAPRAEVVMAAGERAPPEAAAGKKPAAERVAADAPAGDKITLEKAAADKAAADKAAVDKAAAEKAAAEKAAAAQEKAAADKAAADKVAAEKAAMAKLAAEKPVPARAAAVVPGNVAADIARAEAERATAEAMKARADADVARKEAEKTIANVGFALAAAESKLAFIYGLIAGVVLLGVASIVFLAMRRRLDAGQAHPGAATPESGSREKKFESDRLFAAFLDEKKRRDRKALEPGAPLRKQQVEEPAIV